MPSSGTKKRGIRIDDVTWAAFQAATRGAGIGVSDAPLRMRIRLAECRNNQTTDKD